MSQGERVYYEPPKGAEPFVFELGSKLTVFQPPDQYWHQVKEDYRVGVTRDNRGNVIMGADGKALGYPQTRWKWVPDEEKNKEMAEGTRLPPRNYQALSADELLFISPSRFSEPRPFLR